MRHGNVSQLHPPADDDSFLDDLFTPDQRKRYAIQRAAEDVVNGSMGLTPHRAMIVPRPVDWLIDGFLTRDSLATLFGPPKQFKSFTAIDLAHCVATGRAWHFNEAKQAPVVYMAGEGHVGLSRRYRAWCLHNEVAEDEDIPLVTTRWVPPLLASEADALAYQIAVDAVEQHYGQSPGLVVVDTLARTFGGGDENKAQDMGLFIKTMDAIRTKHGCCVLIVHHTGIATNGRPRGSTSFLGAMDAAYSITSPETGIVEMKATDIKDFEPPKTTRFETLKVELGDGDNSIVLRQTDHAPVRGGSGLGRNQQNVLDALREVEPGVRVAATELAEQLGLTRQTVHRIKRDLQRRRLIECDSRNLWLVQPG